LNPADWPDNIRDAKAIQAALRDRVKIIPLYKQPNLVAAVDAAFSGEQVIGAACVYSYPELILKEEVYAATKVYLSYIPGYLSFREGPAIIEALKKLKTDPDVILFDGQGIAHPKGLGIASHIGVILNKPTIGCAKSKLVGEYEEPGMHKGDKSFLRYNKKTIGIVLRTKENVKPVFVSPGHRLDLKSSVEIILRCTGKYRIPDPLRRADILSKEAKREIVRTT
jgi:deoxyribonuclease V